MTEWPKGVKGEIDQRPKRFYTRVDVSPADGGFEVTLDGKSLRTPEKKLCVYPTEALARVIAEEWDRQGERIDLQSMFNVRLANVVLDRTPALRGELAEEVARFAVTDLTSHFADGPSSLRAEQQAGWEPVREWAAETIGARLEAVEGILAKAQPSESLRAISVHAMSLDDFRLTALVHAAGLFGSAVLALAVERGRISAVEAHRLSRIDEDFQARQWGEDAEAVTRAERLKDEARALDLWFGALPLAAV